MMATMATSRRADMFTADGKPSDDDPREHRARLGDERVTLTESLRCQRLTLEMKCAGLDACGYWQTLWCCRLRWRAL
jgi:hypothetical protein